MVIYIHKQVTSKLRKGDTEMIKEVVVKGKEIMVRYESEVWKFYMKKEDIPFGLKGVHVLPKTVVNFMRQNPDKVR